MPDWPFLSKLRVVDGSVNHTPIIHPLPTSPCELVLLIKDTPLVCVLADLSNFPTVNSYFQKIMADLSAI